MEESNVTEKYYVNFIQVPRLRDIAILKIVIELYQQGDIKKTISEHFTDNKREKKCHKIQSCYERTKNMVFEKLACLLLSDNLELQISNWIKPIGLQMIQHLERLDLNAILIYSLDWKVNGRIDEAKTIVLNSESIPKNVFSKCSIISKFCLEDNFKNVWEQLSRFSKNRLYDICLKKTYRYHLLLYWICCVKNDLDKFVNLIIPYNRNGIYDLNYSVAENMFRLAILEVNVYAAEHFWRKLTQNEKRGIIINGVSFIGNILNERKKKLFEYQGTNNHSDLVCFLLSKMNGEQQKMVFEKHSSMILKMFSYDWPWQSYLLLVLNLMWDFLNGDVYIKLLAMVANQIQTHEPLKLFPIHNILKQLFYSAPNNLKMLYIRYLIKKPSNSWVLGNLIEIGDVETPSDILQFANIKERKRMMNASIEGGWVKLVIRSRLNFLDVMLTKSFEREINIKYFKSKTIARWGDSLCSEWISNGNYDAAENLLRWGITSESEIVHYKKEVLDKFKTIENMIRKDNLASLDRFMSWCFSSNSEISEFRQGLINDFKQFIHFFTDWNAFLYFVKWCFISEKEINKFRNQQSKLDVMLPFISHEIQTSYKLQFSQNILDWCYNSKKEVCDFKTNLILSKDGFNIFVKFLNNVNYGNSYNWELLKRLAKFYYPLDEEVIDEVIEILIHYFIYNNKNCTKKEPVNFLWVKIKIIFHLLENYALNASNEENNLRNDTVSKQILKETKCYNVFKQSINMDNKVSHTLKNYSDSSISNEDSNCSNTDDECDSTNDTSSDDESVGCAMFDKTDYRYFYNSDIVSILENLSSDFESDYSDVEDCDISDILIEYDEDVAVVLIDILKRIEI